MILIITVFLFFRTESKESVGLHTCVDQSKIINKERGVKGDDRGANFPSTTDTVNTRSKAEGASQYPAYVQAVDYDDYEIVNSA